jgi:transcriptional regulator with XRE-family HTH domain
LALSTELVGPISTRKLDMNQLDIASAVVARRKALGLTQAELADLADMSRATLSAVENAAEDRGVTVSTLLTVLSVLGLSLRIEP